MAEFWGQWVIYFGVSLASLNILFFVKCCLSDPGVHQKSYEDSLLSDIQYMESQSPLILYACAKCAPISSERQVVRDMSKTEHCLECGVCVYEYDHHCEFFDRCIGKDNKIWFNLTVGLIFINMVWLMFSFILVSHYRKQ